MDWPTLIGINPLHKSTPKSKNGLTPLIKHNLIALLFQVANIDEEKKHGRRKKSARRK